MAKQKQKQITKRKGGPIPNHIKQPIIEELTKIVESGNILGVSNQYLADKFTKEYQINIKRQTIGSYLETIYKNIPEEDIKQTKVKIEVMFNKIFRIVQDMVASAKTQKDKKEAIDLLLRAMDKFTAFLESFGIKPKAVENYNITGDITSRSIDIQIIDDRREIKNENSDNKDIQTTD